MVLNNTTDYKTKNYNALATIVSECQTVEECGNARLCIEESDVDDKSDLYETLCERTFDLFAEQD